MTSKKYICPECNANEGVNILYGYPTDETLQSWFKKEVELGGCIIGKETPHINVLNVVINGKCEI